MSMSKNPLLVEKYRPRKIADCILPEILKKTFQEFVDKKTMPNLLLTGGSGVGKTTVARAMLEELGCDYIVINASLKGNIDTLRTEIQEFASSVSFSGGRKYVILDEADYLNQNSVQPALRNFMEEYSKNCGFILTCNYKNRILPALQSRCSVIEFRVPKKEAPELARQFYARLVYILMIEGVTYDRAALVSLIEMYYPDWRKILNEVQRYSIGGKIDAGILTNTTLSDESFKTLIGYMKSKNFSGIRKWVGENSDIETSVLYRRFYDTCVEYFTKASVPQLILHLAKYQAQAAIVADPEINNVACLVEILVDCEMG